MGANRKKTKPAGERASQTIRSSRNKQKRIVRNKAAKGLGTKAPHYVKAKLGNRLRRLNRRVNDVSLDRQKWMADRIDEIQKILQN